ncbi:MAG TPA: DUF748 domain-containing protein, partial [Opitutus sp.]|nr:DUF748 domain-containing protein [Opitutus sp.]
MLLVMAGLLLAVRFIGSPIATSLANRKLMEMPEVVGRVDDVTLALWRGAIDVRDLVLHLRGHEDEPPLAHIRKATMRIAPSALFSGKLGASVIVDGAEFHAVKRERIEDPLKAAEEVGDEVQEKKEQAARWQDALRDTFPMELAKLEVKDARVVFLDRTHQPTPELVLERLHVVAHDLQNRPKANDDPLPAKIEITGVTTGNGELRSSIQVNPIAEQPRFTMDFELRGMQLPPLNNFLRAYANADVSRGSFEVFVEVDAEGGAYNGYVKPMFHDLEFRTASDEDKNFAEKLKGKAVAAVASVFKNDEADQVASKAPFAG